MLTLIEDEQREMWTAKDIEQPSRRSRLVFAAGVGSAIPRSKSARIRPLVPRQRTFAIANAELLRLTPALRRFFSVEPFADAENRRGDRTSLGVVAFEERVRCASKRTFELPSKIVCVLHSGIQPLATARWMNMRSIASEKDASLVAPRARQP
jgi:hypothetical protein